MTDLYIIVVTAVVVAHFAFLVYLVTGGFLALWWPRTIWVHVAAVLWGIGSVVLHFPCPLTWLERWAREHAGLGPLPPGGFIVHYLTGVIYPARAAGLLQGLAFATVCVSWAVYAAAARRRRSSAQKLAE